MSVSSKEQLIRLIKGHQQIKRPQFLLYSSFDHHSSDEMGKQFLEDAGCATKLEELKSAWEKYQKHDAGKRVLLQIEADGKIIFVLASRKDLEKKMEFFRPIFSDQFLEKKDLIRKLHLSKETRLSWPEICGIIILVHKTHCFDTQLKDPEFFPCCIHLFAAAKYLFLKTVPQIIQKNYEKITLRHLKDDLKELIESSRKVSKKRKDNGGRIVQKSNEWKAVLDSCLKRWTADQVNDLEWLPLLT